MNKRPSYNRSPLELELQLAVSCLMWAMGTELQSSSRTASTLTTEPLQLQERESWLGRAISVKKVFIVGSWGNMRVSAWEEGGRYVGWVGELGEILKGGNSEFVCMHH